MTVSNIDECIDSSERDQRSSKSKAEKMESGEQPWWKRLAGTFKDDPLFDEIVKQGKQYRKSLSRQNR